MRPESIIARDTRHQLFYTSFYLCLVASSSCLEINCYVGPKLAVVVGYCVLICLLTFQIRFILKLKLGNIQLYMPIDLFRGACTVKGNVPAAGYVKRVGRGDPFDALTFQ